MLRLIPWLLVVGVTIYTLVDCAQTDDDEVRSLPKLVWVLLILIFPPIGAIAWLVAGRPQRPSRMPRGPRGPGGSSRSPRAPRGPDDDPDFLRRL
jgi:hypothetical protein